MIVLGFVAFKSDIQRVCVCELALGYLKNKVSQDLYKVNYHILLEKQVTSDI